MWTTPRTWVTGELVTSSLLNTHLRDNLNAVLPIGTLIYRVIGYSAVELALEGRWLYCNGVAVSRTTYADLFAYINAHGLPFGPGNGSTTFNIPDMRGRVPVALGEHADVGHGVSEGAVVAHRRPRHFHYVRLNLQAATAGGGSNAGAPDANSVTTAEGAANNIDGTPAYLVVGGYLIKYN